MRYFVSDLCSDRKLFIGDYDSFTIIKYGITIEDLLILSKLGLLIFDRLLLPAAFFWQTQEMTQLLLRLQQPIEQGIILPVIRNSESTADVLDYYERRMEESTELGNIAAFKYPELASEIASKKNMKQVHLLNYTDSYAHLDLGSIREQYASNVLNDIKNHYDISSVRMLLAQSSVSKEKCNEIREALSRATDHPLFSRAYAVDLIQNLLPCGRCREQIIERISYLYLKSNAKAYSSSFYYSRNSENGLVFEDNLLLLGKTLDVFGLTKGVIKSLSIEGIMQIKNSSEYQHFIDNYHCLISKVYTKQTNAVSVIQKKLNKEIQIGKLLTSLMEPINKIQNTSASIFLALLANKISGSPVNDKLLVGMGGASLISSVIKRISDVNMLIDSRAFYDFKCYILEKKYEERLHRLMEVHQ